MAARHVANISAMLLDLRPTSHSSSWACPQDGVATVVVSEEGRNGPAIVVVVAGTVNVDVELVAGGFQGGSMMTGPQLKKETRRQASRKTAGTSSRSFAQAGSTTDAWDKQINT